MVVTKVEGKRGGRLGKWVQKKVISLHQEYKIRRISLHCAR